MLKKLELFIDNHQNVIDWTKNCKNFSIYKNNGAYPDYIVQLKNKKTLSLKIQQTETPNNRKNHFNIWINENQ